MDMSANFVSITYDGPLQIIKFIRPAKRNSFSVQTYSAIRSALKAAASNDQVKMTLFTGEGEFFSSGNEFVNPEKQHMDEDMETTIRNAVAHVRDFIHALIDYPKLLVALVNGPAYGIAVTMLGLFDLVFALKTATFSTPFLSLGISPEGCSSYTFPRLFGKSLAGKMIYLNNKITAEEARACGFVADIVIESEISNFINYLKKLMNGIQLKTLVASKQLLIGHDIKSLHYANTVECETLVELFQSEEFINSVLNMMKRKSKL